MTNFGLTNERDESENVKTIKQLNAPDVSESREIERRETRDRETRDEREREEKKQKEKKSAIETLYMCTFLRPVKSEKKTTTHTKNKEGTRAHCFHCVPTQREREKNLSSIIDEGLFRCRCCCFLSLSLSRLLSSSSSQRRGRIKASDYCFLDRNLSCLSPYLSQMSLSLSLVLSKEIRREKRSGFSNLFFFSFARAR